MKLVNKNSMLFFTKRSCYRFVKLVFSLTNVPTINNFCLQFSIPSFVNSFSLALLLHNYFQDSYIINCINFEDLRSKSLDSEIPNF